MQTVPMQRKAMRPRRPRRKHGRAVRRAHLLLSKTRPHCSAVRETGEVSSVRCTRPRAAVTRGLAAQRVWRCSLPKVARAQRAG